MGTGDSTSGGGGGGVLGKFTYNWTQSAENEAEHLVIMGVVIHRFSGTPSYT